MFGKKKIKKRLEKLEDRTSRMMSLKQIILEELEEKTDILPYWRIEELFGYKPEENVVGLMYGVEIVYREKKINNDETEE